MPRISIYTDEVIAYIKASYKKGMKQSEIAELAAKIGAGATGLRRKLSEWKMLHRDAVKTGDIHIKVRFGAKVKCQLQENGKWKPLERLTEYKVKKSKNPRPKKVKILKPKDVSFKPREKLIEVKQPKVKEPTKLVYVDSKTQIEIPVSMDANQAIANYKKKMDSRTKNR